MTEPQPGPDNAVAFARRLLGGRTTAFGWGGRTRVVIADTGPRARLAGARSAPAFRVATRAFRSVHALRHAALPTGVVEGPPSSLHDALPACLVGLRPVSIIVGTPGPCRSLVIRWTDASGRPTVALKVGAAPHAAANIRSEVRALADPSLKGKAPALLWAGTIEGREAVATAHVAGRPGSLGSDGALEASSVLPAVQADGPTVPADRHPWIARTLAKTGLPSALLDRLQGEWPIVRLHGDLAPWNLIRKPDGGIVAIDWESSEGDGLPGVDLAHHAIATALALRGTDAKRIVVDASARLSRHLDLAEPAARAVVALAAGAIALRRREEANDAAARRWDELATCAVAPR